MLHNYGVSVTLVEFLDRIVPTEDADVSAELARRYPPLQHPGDADHPGGK